MYIDGVNLPDPSTERELADLLAEADRAHLGVTPKGAATKQDWGNPPSRACFYLSTAKLNRVLEHAWADMTVTVEAGCTFGVLQATLAEHGQRLTADPLWPEKATVGGMLATNDTGALRLMYGGLRDLIIGITLALPDGTLAKSGGKVVKNVKVGKRPRRMAITPDGKELWVSGRYDEEVYVFDVTTGKMTHRIAVGVEPHGLCVWPQPGRFSLGHTGNMR